MQKPEELLRKGIESFAKVRETARETAERIERERAERERIGRGQAPRAPAPAPSR